MPLRVVPLRRSIEAGPPEAGLLPPAPDNDADDMDVTALARRLGPSAAARPRRRHDQFVLFAGVGLIALLGTTAVALLSVGWPNLPQPRPASLVAAPSATVAVKSARLKSPPLAEPAVQPVPARSAAEFAAGLSTLRAQMQATAGTGGQRDSEVSPSPLTRSAEVPAVVVKALADGHGDALASRPMFAAADRPGTPVPPPASGLSAAEIVALLQRAQTLISVGDIAGARRFAERAADGGDATALFTLAETFDPTRLKQWRVRGVRADPARARELYQHAADRGLSEARARLVALP